MRAGVSFCFRGWSHFILVWPRPDHSDTAHPPFFSYLECGDVRYGTLAGPSFVGGSSPDAIYALTAWEATTFVVSTCSETTRFGTRLLLYSGRPRPARGAAVGNVTQLAESHDADCNTLVYDLPVASTIFVVVEAMNAEDAGEEPRGKILDKLTHSELTRIFWLCQASSSSACSATRCPRR